MNESAIEATAKPGREAAEGTIRVLHVDDDPDFADLTATFLERTDDRLAVETATSPDDELDRIADGAFDCVVSDYDMPGTDGMDFLDAVREERPDLPFILFTGKGSEDVASEAFTKGATDYVRKGTGPDRYALLANCIGNAAEKAQVERQRDRLLSTVEAAHDGIHIVDGDERIDYVNEAFADMFGYEPAELVGERVEVLYPDEELERLRETVLPALRERGDWRGQQTAVRADGERFPVDLAVTRTGGGAMLCAVRDLSAQRDRQRRLDEREETLRRMYDVVTDRSAQFETKVENLLELGREALGTEAGMLSRHRGDDGVVETVVGRQDVEPGEPVPSVVGRCCEWTVEDERAVVIEGGDDPRGESGVCQCASDGDAACYLASPVVLDGETYGAVYFYDPDARAEEVSDWDLALVDLTTGWLEYELERRAAVRDLVEQNERLDAFASMVSHDLRNPLNVAQGRLELAREACECDAPHLDDVADALDRSQAIVDDVLLLARDEDRALDPEPVDLADVADRSWEHVATNGATLAVEADRQVHADRRQLRRVFENLFRNAVEHGGEDVTVAVGDLEDGFYVEDDGPGIPEGERDRVFESGYSTGEHSTGLGLAIVSAVVDAHGWDVRATEGDAGGARFEVSVGADGGP